MTTKHTMGPWEIGYGGLEGDTFATITSPHSKFPICQLEPNGYNQANAQLIASAPELLAMCENALEALTGLNESNACMSDFERACIPSLQAVISKAKGGAL